MGCDSKRAWVVPDDVAGVAVAALLDGVAAPLAAADTVADCVDA
jgi:hypothetical protein